MNQYLHCCYRIYRLPTTSTIRRVNWFVWRNGVELGSLFYNLRRYL